MKSIIDCIGNTPLIELSKIYNGNGKLYAKLEYLNPSGSVKDRVALQTITDAYKNGVLKKGQLVVEMTSGNMGAGLALVCKQFGNPFVAVMSEGNSIERRKILSALGAEILLTEQVDGSYGMVTGKDIDYAADVARKYAIKNNAFFVDQFRNPSSKKAHFNTTGPEIWDKLPNIDAFIASIGSGGTFVGTSQFLKSKNPNIKCIAVEPENTAIIKTGNVISTKHIIQGTGYGSVPHFWNENLVDTILTVNDDEVFDMTKKLSEEQGMFVGFSAGANVCAAVKYLKQENSNLNVVTILCDTGFKY